MKRTPRKMKEAFKEYYESLTLEELTESFIVAKSRVQIMEDVLNTKKSVNREVQSLPSSTEEKINV